MTFEQRTGGFLKKERKNSKAVYFINAQTRVDESVIESAREYVDEFLSTAITLKNGDFDFRNPRIEGELSLFIIDDEQMPMSLIAPEARWAFVNVAPLTKGRGEKKPYLEARAKKEIARIAVGLYGGVGSEYKKTLLSFVDAPDKLDKFEDVDLPVDAQSRCKQYLLDMGVKHWKRSNYRQACMEGWAPAPTNDVQKTIWDDVHKTPEKPIKITFDKDKQKPVVK